MAVLAALAGLLLGALVAAARAEAMAPVATVVFGADGKLWRVMPRKDWLDVDYSTDLGVTFSKPVRVNAKRQRVRAIPEDRPQLAITAEGRIFVTWAADARQPWTRYIAWSGDGGRTFSPAVPVSDAADRVLQYQTVVQAGSDGTARVFWVDTRNQKPDAVPIGSLFSATFRPDAWATPRSVQLHDATCECCRLAEGRDADGGTLLLARLVIDERIRDIGIVSVAANGTASTRRVTDDGWEITACPEHGPALAVGPRDRYHMAWFTLGTQRKGVFYAHSDDGGKTLSAPVAIGDPSQLAGHAAVGVRGDTVAIAWQQYDGKRTSIHVMLSADDGNSWQSPREVAGSSAEADYPFVLSDGRGLYLSWYAADSGYHLYPLAQAGG